MLALLALNCLCVSGLEALNNIHLICRSAAGHESAFAVALDPICVQLITLSHGSIENMLQLWTEGIFKHPHIGFQAIESEFIKIE